MSYRKQRNPYDPAVAMAQARSLAGGGGTYTARDHDLTALRSTMTRAAFETIADVMYRTKEGSETHTHWTICYELALVLKAKNGNFKFDKFIERCGYPEASVMMEDVGGE